MHAWYIGLKMILKFCYYIYWLSMCPVVVWCDCVGDLQWRTDPLPCRGLEKPLNTACATEM